MGEERVRRLRKRIVVLIMTLMAVAVLGSCGSLTARCGSIQKRVDAAAAGDTVNLPDGCVYHQEVTIGKPLRLVGSSDPNNPVTILGSDEWTGWERSGNHWIKGKLPNFPQRGASKCKPGTSRCKWPEQVFFDGHPLFQVASDPKPGQFAVTDDRKVVIANNPLFHTVEVTTRRFWIDGRSDGVTVKGFTMSHAANAARSGAIRNNGFDDWTVRDNNLSYAHGTDVTLGDAKNLKILGNDIHHAGQLGIGSHEAELEVRNNKIHDNNTEAFDASWAAGGMKATGALRLVVDGNSVYRNDRTGVWADQGSKNVTYSNNRVHHNSKRGLHLEVTDGAKIYGNVVWENGWGEGGGTGISATASRNVDIHDNVLAWNYDGVAVVNTMRQSGFGGKSPIWDRVKNVRVHDNTILSEDHSGPGEHLALIWNQAYAGGNLYDPAAGNRGYDNRYWFPDAEGSGVRYMWDGTYDKLSAFDKTPGERQGRYLSDAEKARVVAANDIPAYPETHLEPVASSGRSDAGGA